MRSITRNKCTFKYVFKTVIYNLQRGFTKLINNSKNKGNKIVKQIILKKLGIL